MFTIVELATVFFIAAHLAELSCEERQVVVQKATEMAKADLWEEKLQFEVTSERGLALILTRIKEGERRLLLELTTYKLGKLIRETPRSKRDSFVKRALQEAQNLPSGLELLGGI